MSMHYILGFLYVCIRVSLPWLPYQQQQTGIVTLIPCSEVIPPLT